MEKPTSNQKLKKAQDYLFEKATRKVEKLTKKKVVKEAPKTLFGMQIKHNPKAHKFSVAMAMVGLSTDIESADLILRLFDKLDEMGGRFDISSAVDLKYEVMNEYEAIKEQFEKTNKNK
jgi:hypothetical protein